MKLFCTPGRRGSWALWLSLRLLVQVAALLELLGCLTVTTRHGVEARLTMGAKGSKGWGLELGSLGLFGALVSWGQETGGSSGV